jgi:O-Antigen ligase
VRSLPAALTGVPRGRLVVLPAELSTGGLVLAAAMPILFLHVDYQPSLVVTVGGAAVTVKLSDVVVLVVALTAAALVRRRGLAPLRPGIPVWVTGFLFLAWIGAATFYPLLSAASYAWKTHLVTGGEFAEYALLAPAVPLLIRRRADGVLVLGTLTAWAALATIVGLVQWSGLNILHSWGQGRRQPSFVGVEDFAALSAMAIGIGAVTLLWNAQGPVRRGAWTALVAGTVGFVLAGSTAGIIGLAPAALIVAAVAVRRGRATRMSVAACLAAVLLASVGVVALRAGDFGHFFRFIGARHENAAAAKNIQTYSQRTLLAYIGVRIWLHHPVVGAGWQASNEFSVFGRELPAARRRFPHLAPIAFPSARHPYGVQDLYVETLADLGIVGLTLLVGLFGSGIWPAAKLAFGPAPDAFIGLLALFWLVASLGLWTATGLIAGLPLDALTWLAFGVSSVRLREAAA